MGIKYWVSHKNYNLYLKTKKAIRQTYIKNLLDNKISIRKKKGKVSSFEKNRLYKLVENLNQKSSVLSKIMVMNIYLEQGFYGKVDSIINSIIKNEYIKDFFDTEGLYIRQKEISKKVLAILLNLKIKFDDKRLVNTLISYLSYGIDQDLRSLILDDFDIPNKLSYVQERIKSVNYAIMYPFVWTPWIEKYSSSIELDSYLDKTNLYTYLNDGELKYLSSLRSSFPKEENKRKTILNAYKAILKTKNPYLYDVKIRIQENERFITYLIKNKMATKPLFVEMRKFYRSEVKKNRNISYGIYNLIKIGDMREEYFIKSLALKNNGL